jgi:hypothetical protein
MLITILIVCALACFLLGTFGVAARVNLTDLGLAFLTLVVLMGRGIG